MYSSTTVLTSWAAAIARTLEQRGADSHALFHQAGLDPELLSDPNARYPVTGTAHLWQLAVAETGDDAIGVAVAGNVGPTTFHALGYSLSASGSLQEAFDRIVRYFRIVTDAADVAFEREDGVSWFRARIPPSKPIPAPEAIDAFMALIVRLCRDLYGPTLNPLRVELERARPRNVERFEAYFQAPVEFGAAENALCFPVEAVDRRLPGGNPELARINDQVVREYLARLDRENISNRVHVLLTQLLPSGTASQENVARAMHMSLRSLQRRLSEEGVTYKSVLDDTRKELALSYMREGGHSVGELTYLLGFSDSSSFARAFKRWTGKSPRQYRAEK